MDMNAMRSSGAYPVATPARPLAAMTSTLLDAIAWRSDREVLQVLRDATNRRQAFDPAVLSDAISLACQTGRSAELKQTLTRLAGFDPNAIGSHGHSPLAAAVRCGDVDFARHLLQQGADPGPHLDAQPVAGDRRRMTKLLHAAATINALLPRHARQGAAAAATPLQQALQDYDLRRARTLLKQELQARGPIPAGSLWQQVVKEGRRDMQCAILALSSPRTIDRLTAATPLDGHSALNRSMRDASPGLRAYLKQFPYRSLRHEYPLYNNGTVKFRDSGKLIVCRHLSAFWLRQRIKERAWKTGYADLGSAKAIEAAIPSKIQAAYVSFINHAPEAHMVRAADWGAFLAGRFEEMLIAFAPGNEPIKKYFFLSTSNHAMGLELKITAGRDGRPAFAALLYDPNETNTHKRASCKDLAVVRQWEFQAFLLAPGCQQQYFLESTPLLMAFAIPENHPALQEDYGASAGGAEPNRRLSSGIPSLSGEAIFHLLRGGFGGELRARKEEILAYLKEQGPITASHVLMAADGRRVPGLYVACQEGHHDTIAALGEILMASEVSAEDKACILECRAPNGPPGMYAALSLGRADTVAALGHIIGHAGLAPADMTTLFLARYGKSDMPGLLAAHANGHQDAVDAFKQSVYRSDLTKEQRATIWKSIANAAYQS